MAPVLLDLFSGVGGISLGFEQAGFTTVGANDFDDNALDAYALNHPDAVIWRGPIESLDTATVLDDLGMGVGELDVLVGGPPCQGFSKNRARRHVDGEFVEDPRNHLFKEYLRFVDELKPRVVLIENVPEILIKNDGQYAAEIRKRLHSMGYSMNARVLNAVDYGVPQRRRRAIILAAREGVVPMPEPTHGEQHEDALFGPAPFVTIRDAIGDLSGLPAGAELLEYPRQPATTYQKERRGERDRLSDHLAWTMSPVQAERLSYLGEGDGCEKLPSHLAPKSGYGSAYRRMSWDVPALTITTWMYHPGSGMFYHPSDARTITLREGARLQSFDDSVQFSGGKVAKCRQVGNAVPPLLARAIAQAVRSATGSASAMSGSTNWIESVQVEAAAVLSVQGHGRRCS